MAWIVKNTGLVGLVGVALMTAVRRGPAGPWVLGGAYLAIAWTLAATV